MPCALPGQWDWGPIVLFGVHHILEREGLDKTPEGPRRNPERRRRELVEHRIDRAADQAEVAESRPVRFRVPEVEVRSRTCSSVGAAWAVARRIPAVVVVVVVVDHKAGTGLAAEEQVSAHRTVAVLGEGHMDLVVGSHSRHPVVVEDQEAGAGCSNHPEEVVL